MADGGNHVIRKITPTGVVTTLAGSAGAMGSADGIGGAARFEIPAGIATDTSGNIYVADQGNHTIRKITSLGVVTTLAGTAGITGSANGIGAAASFHSPVDIATDIHGNIYVADYGNHNIRKITPEGVVTTLAGTTYIDLHSPASFFIPSAVATDAAGNVYVTDVYHNEIRKITQAGVVTTLAGAIGGGNVDGTGAAARFLNPTGIAIDRDGNAFVADTGNNTIRKITSEGIVTTLAGTAGVAGYADGVGATASFRGPYGVAVDIDGNVYVADGGSHVIRKITPAGVTTTLAGAPDLSGTTDGVGETARFTGPAGIATDSLSNIYVADTGNHTIRKITPAGAVTTLAGAAGVNGNSDGPASGALFSSPRGVTTDNAGYVYIADTGNSTIRKISPSGDVTTLAGFSPPWPGSADGSGPSARFSSPMGVAADPNRNIYVADTYNCTIRKITPAGNVTTLAGFTWRPNLSCVGDGADGTGSAASFVSPVGIATDANGNIYVADTGNHIIRKITSEGVVTTLAGTSHVVGHVDGIGGAASFNGPKGIATDAAGNVYVADTGNHIIRKITPTGIVSTVVGTAGARGFVPGALPGVLNLPIGVSIAGTTLYITMANAVVQVTNVP